MSIKDEILHCVLKKEWFKKIESGEKTIEYRRVTPYWEKRILEDGFSRLWPDIPVKCCKVNKIRFQLGMTSDPKKRMLFEIDGVFRKNGLETDLNIDAEVFCILLGRRLQ